MSEKKSNRDGSHFPAIRPVTLGEVLGKSAELRPKSGQVSLDTWRQAVGSRIAERSRPRRLQNGALWVEVASSTWAQELSLHADTIITRLRNAGISIETLRFRIGAAAFSEDKSTKKAPRAQVREAELPSDLKARIERVEDAELRQVIARAAAFGLGRTRQKK